MYDANATRLNLEQQLYTNLAYLEEQAAVARREAGIMRELAAGWKWEELQVTAERMARYLRTVARVASEVSTHAANRRSETEGPPVGRRGCEANDGEPETFKLPPLESLLASERD